MAICIPFGYLNLDENMWFQWLSFAGLLIFTIEFYVQFVANMTFWNDGLDYVCLPASDHLSDANISDCDYYHKIPPVGSNYTNLTHNGVARTPAFISTIDGQSQVIGLSVFAYAYVVTIPSWVNEKKPGVRTSEKLKSSSD